MVYSFEYRSLMVWIYVKRPFGSSSGFFYEMSEIYATFEGFSRITLII